MVGKEYPDESSSYSRIPSLQENCDAIALQYLEARDCCGKSTEVLQQHKSAILAAYEHLWNAQVAHLDVHRRNLSISREGHVKILDFGLSRLVSSAEEARKLDEDALGDMMSM
jgi:serine/threonine protein kinase